MSVQNLIDSTGKIAIQYCPDPYPGAGGVVAPSYEVCTPGDSIDPDIEFSRLEPYTTLSGMTFPTYSISGAPAEDGSIKTIVSGASDAYEYIGNGSVGTFSSTVNCVFDLSDYLYIGGGFTNIQGDNLLGRFCKYNKTTRQFEAAAAVNPFTSGTISVIKYIEVAGVEKLILGGSQICSISGGNYITIYDVSDSTFEVATVNTINSTVNALCVDNTNSYIYIGGAFTSPSTGIARYTFGGAVAALGGTSSTINALTDVFVRGGKECFAATGNFTNFFSTTSVRVGVYNITDNSVTAAPGGGGGGLNNSGNGIFYDSSNDRLYITGSFTAANAVPNTREVCYWNLSSNAFVSMFPALATAGSPSGFVKDADGKLYIYGTYSNYYGLKAISNIAVWDEAAGDLIAYGGQILGGGITYAVQSSDDGIYICGSFTNTSSNFFLNRIVKFYPRRVVRVEQTGSYYGSTYDFFDLCFENQTMTLSYTTAGEWICTDYNYYMNQNSKPYPDSIV